MFPSERFGLAVKIIVPPNEIKIGTGNDPQNCACPNSASISRNFNLLNVATILARDPFISMRIFRRERYGVRRENSSWRQFLTASAYFSAVYFGARKFIKIQRRLGEELRFPRYLIARDFQQFRHQRDLGKNLTFERRHQGDLEKNFHFRGIYDSGGRLKNFDSRGTARNSEEL